MSTADPGKLYLPVIQSLVYHHNHVNVEAQMASGSSRLHWVRGMLAVLMPGPPSELELREHVPGPLEPPFHIETKPSFVIHQQIGFYHHRKKVTYAHYSMEFFPIIRAADDEIRPVIEPPTVE